ncbi:L-asparaginase [Erythrobacter sp. KY5]|uniref:asparaginase n=1 Tax=Erythrobacter sp. KY5 TaxID=2011159 RepID=UPI000DBEFCB7|nr:asparaginase [Erythrobacter sp. KY5]AWW74081.1 L-asparaginase [Erythrobacter sp. KY5]
MTNPRILVLGTGGTIAGIAGDAMRHDYLPGQIGIDQWLEDAGRYALDVEFVGQQVANVGSEDMGPVIWGKLHRAIAEAMEDDSIDGVIVTHGTDTAEETAFLLDLTLPLNKPVVLVGAMRPADAVGSDGMRNFVNAVRVAAAESAKGRGVLLVMGDRVLAARDARKVRTRGTDDAFRGFPRGSVAIVTPSALDWFGKPWRDDARPRFAFPDEFPEVPILYAAGGISPATAERLLVDAKGVVVAGVGEGNMPDAVRAVLADRASKGLLVVRASRVDEGLVDREPEDDENRFVASRALNPQKSRILAMVMLANGVSDPADFQAVFDRP